MDLGERKAQYDNSAKQILSQKKLLARILKRTVPEFELIPLNTIANKCIEGEPFIGNVPVDKDETNPMLQFLQEQKTSAIIGSHNEDNSTSEGKVIFDLLFHARVPSSGELITLIINVEAQRSIHPTAKHNGKDIEYPLLKRAVYYASRLISSQKGTIFTGSDYGSIQKVYSIWICMEAPNNSSAINRYQLKEQHLLHRYKESAENYDLINIVFVYLGNKKVQDKMMDMLQLIFKRNLGRKETERILKEEYDIDFNAAGKEALDTMCNLSEGIYEEGRAEGRAEGQETERMSSIRALMKNAGYSAEKAMELLNIDKSLWKKYLALL